MQFLPQQDTEREVGKTVTLKNYDAYIWSLWTHREETVPLSGPWATLRQRRKEFFFPSKATQQHYLLPHGKNRLKVMSHPHLGDLEGVYKTTLGEILSSSSNYVLKYTSVFCF